MDTRGVGSEHKRAYPGAILQSNVDAFPSAEQQLALDSKSEGERGGRRGESDQGNAEHGGRRMVSATRVVALLVLALAVVAVLVPLPLHRPLWIEAEAVVGVWWALWAVLLTSMLYVGIGLRDDLRVAAGTTADGGDQWWYHLGELNLHQIDWFGVDEGGWLLALLALVLLGVFILIGVMLTEIVLPLLIPLGYAVVMWMLRRVVHHHPACQRNLARSLGLGLWWASVYSAPFALAVALMHVLF